MSHASTGSAHSHGHGHDGAQTDDRPTVAIVVDARHAANQVIRDTQISLEAAGCDVRLVAPDADDLFDIPAEAPTWDAVVSRGRNPSVLALMTAAAALGVLAINPPRAIGLVRNKVGMQAVLAGHGMPLPRAWFTASPAALRRVPRAHFPLVVKPFDGDGSVGLSLVESPEDAANLAGAGDATTLYIAQKYLDADGWDLKLYGIGSDVWAVRKPAAVRFEGGGPGLPPDVGEPERVDMDARLRDIALTCGRACGLELWGVDVAVTPDGPYVIEVNDFPTYSAVPDAGALIARHILALTRLDALRKRSGQERMRSLVWSPA